MKPQFIIAAPTSNSGKTTLTLGLLRALENRGVKTQPFKVGPDYIDPKFHEIASGKPGVNLDLFMMDHQDIHTTYETYTKQADVACIEGVMGLFDGARKSEGSTAELSKVLDLPIILVVDAKSVAYSVAPLLYGFKHFDQDIHIAGVIFNRVNTKSHYLFLQEACQDVGIPTFGHLPFIPEAEIPSRHLGLSIDKIEGYDATIERVAEQLEQHVDINLILKTCTKAEFQSEPQLEHTIKRQQTKRKIAIAKDEGFNFTYVQNIETLKEMGEVIFFSPMNDSVLPQADFVYLPGGYPECFTEQLSNNSTMLASIKAFAESGGHILAECGGMMYLGKSIIDQSGNKFPMANVFNFETSLQDMKLTLGYRRIQFNDFEWKGHEFHYSKLVENDTSSSQATVYSAREKEVPTKVFRYKNVWASYIHYYLGQKELVEPLFKPNKTQ